MALQQDKGPNGLNVASPRVRRDRCRAHTACIRQSGPDFGLVFIQKFSKPFKLSPLRLSVEGGMRLPRVSSARAAFVHFGALVVSTPASQTCCSTSSSLQTSRSSSVPIVMRRNNLGERRAHGFQYGGTSLERNRTLLGPYRRHLPRVLWGSLGGGLFLIGEVPL